jgi:hypothetical protein
MHNYGNVRIVDAAQAHPLFQRDANEGFQYGDAFLVLEGGTILLDGMRLKNVVMTGGIQIIYKGGETDLEAVSFANCKLAISNDSRGRQFAALLLNSPLSLKFKTFQINALLGHCRRSLSRSLASGNKSNDTTTRKGRRFAARHLVPF